MKFQNPDMDILQKNNALDIHSKSTTDIGNEFSVKKRTFLRFWKFAFSLLRFLIFFAKRWNLVVKS